MPTLALTVSYNGEPFCGFAKQPGLLTVQGEIERALDTVFGRPVETVCAGRTDAGVHALGQMVSFCVNEEATDGRTERSLLRSLNALTHDDISIRCIQRKPDGFSARFDARVRQYRYFLHTEVAQPLVMADFCWHVPGAMNVDAMREAAGYLIGEHDFKSFCLAAAAQGRPTCRNVMRIDIEPCEVMGDRFICVIVEGNAFLHSMVRSIVGTLVAVGRERRDPEWVAKVLAARDRNAAGENAPAKGLIFWHVVYD